MSTTAGEPSTAGRTLGLVGVITALVGVVSILSLHVLPETSGISVIHRTISEYAYSDLGWVFNGGVLVMAVGSALILAALWRSGATKPWSVGSIALLIWSVSLVVLVIFPKHDWSVGPSSHGAIHRAASLAAFLAVPIAAIALSRGRRAAGRIAARSALGFGILSGLMLSAIIYAFLFRPGGRNWYQVFPLGLIERGIAGFGAAAVIAIGVLAVVHRSAARTSDMAATAPRSADGSADGAHRDLIEQTVQTP